ncbi:Heavy metal-associated isoprenylated plant protein 35 [Cardamine amara subsp. amara]|uniref:Heavy metal-associated isoprenylated plant protein 35 n=1 Tax=Cardamine amara subsp. amara TaxID=228776 RepID=A0ABD1C7R9_CARAN
MATEEMKPETKKTQQKLKQSQQVKEDLPPQILPPLPLPYKSCSLKVSIHCEACKRKVKKILTSIEGVYRVDIDVKQHKVTVMGIISPEILLKKLHKAGKNADLLPEIPDPEETKPIDPKPKEKKKKKEEKMETVDGATSSGSDKPESEKTEAAGDFISGDGGGGEVVKAPATGKNCDPVKKEKKVVLKKKDSDQVKSPSPTETPSPEESSSPAVEKKVGESVGAAGNGNIGKKKKKKGQNLSTAHNPTGAPARTQSLPPPITPATDHDRLFNQIDGHHILTNNNPPRHDMYPYPPPNYYAPQVMYGVSYNIAQPPVSVDAASYYTPPPPYSYAYIHPGHQPFDQNPYPSRPSDSFELFSDENPNGCSVM